jgi:hypothetical protein
MFHPRLIEMAFALCAVAGLCGIARAQPAAEMLPRSALPAQLLPGDAAPVDMTSRPGSAEAMAAGAASATSADGTAQWQLRWVPTMPVSEWWLNPGMLSYHLRRTDRDTLQSRNLGFGAEYRFSTAGSLTAGWFENSRFERSSYFGGYWQPLELAGVRLGLALGFIDGYPAVNSGGWFAAVVPVISYEYERVGLRLLLVPRVEHRVDPTLSLQLRVRVWP